MAMIVVLERDRKDEAEAMTTMGSVDDTVLRSPVRGSGQHEKRVRHAWKASPSYISSLPVSSATSAGIHERIQE